MRSQYLFLILLASLLSSSSRAQSTKNGEIQKMQNQPSYVEHSITSKDGTKIGYLEIGEGPGLILVEGAMGTAYNYDQLARKLATDFTVYLPDRFRQRVFGRLSTAERGDPQATPEAILKIVDTENPFSSTNRRWAGSGRSR